MGERPEDDSLRELRDYFDQRAKVSGDNPKLWEHASEMCRAMLQDIGAADTGPLASIYTRIIGELIIGKQKAIDAAKQAHADEHAALSARDEAVRKLSAARDAAAEKSRRLSALEGACSFRRSELSALAFVERERGMFGESVHRLADFVGRVRSVLGPHIVDAMPDAAPDPVPDPVHDVPTPGQRLKDAERRLKDVEQELRFLWPVVHRLANCDSLVEIRTVARAATDTFENARKERGG